MVPSLVEPVHRLATAWRETTEGPVRRGLVATVGVIWSASLLAARAGTTRARIAALVAMFVSAALGLAWRMRERRRLADPSVVLTRLAVPVDRPGAEKALRALTLVDAGGSVRDPGTSSALARLHVERTLAALPADRIAARGGRVALVAGWFGLLVVAVVATVALVRGWEVLEGADVLVARRGVAPVAMAWLEDIDVVARPPDYVHQDPVHEEDPGPLVLPYGSVLTVHGVPVRSGRSLRLSDGTREVPFVDDGSGGLVARYDLTASCKLRVVARFGDVSIPEPASLAVTSIPDRAPSVVLDGAPRVVNLADEKDDIPLRYEATDDHGLREIDLVLRAGVREERRMLARLDGDAHTEGGHALGLRDEFLRESHGPVEVTVQAKDNDPLSGPKWGISAAITIVPPAVGEPEARRLDALRALRDALVDTLAARLGRAIPADAAGRKALLADDAARDDHDEDLLWSTSAMSYAGVRVPTRSRMLLAAQASRVHDALAAETRTLSDTTRGALIKATERSVLVVDAIVRGLAVKDAHEASKSLSEVADDLAAGASDGQSTDDAVRARSTTRMDTATSVLGSASGQLARLGPTGADLGEIVDADLLRVGRAREANDLVHAELAARDLAARLARPDPSFGSRAGHGQSGGDQSGGTGGVAGGEEEGPDEVDEAFRQAAADLEDLAQSHAAAMAGVEQALSAAGRDDPGVAGDEAKRHAAAVRDAVRPLPPVGSGSDSWTSKGSAARDFGEQMARSLESGRLDEAVQSAGSAIAALEEARRSIDADGWLQDPGSSARGRVDEARRRLEVERAWASNQLERMQRRIADRARPQLTESGQDEAKLGERARKLGDREKDRGSFSQEALDSIDEAARAAHQAAEALERGDAKEGLERQREAQRHLEAAVDEMTDKEESEGPSSDASMSIPKGGKGPVEFRRRVMEGLGRPSSGALRDAVQRYAEGLLR